MQRPAAPRTRAPKPARDVTCPFCALHCDDLEVGREGDRLRPLNTDCPKARAGFGAAAGTTTPLLRGRPVSLDTAVAAAADILRKARAPLFAGLATDLAGARRVLELADRLGGIVDHVHGDALLRNLATLGDSGWMNTTLTEVRNRADFILFAGTDATGFPRFFERVVWNEESQFGLDTGSRQIAYVGEALETGPGRAPDGRRPLSLRCAQDRLGEVLGALRALLAGRRLRARTVAGIDVAALGRLIGRMRAARYGVLVWSPARLAFPHAELTVEAACDLVRDLNEVSRWSGLPVGGDDGALTFAAVCSWTTGYPLRVDFGSGHPVYDPRGNRTAALLAARSVDSLVWISSFADLPAPTATVPRVVLGRAPPAAGEKPPEVFIPVGTPGVHHAGHAVRMDTVVTLPLSAVAPSPLPSVADVVARIAARLE